MKLSVVTASRTVLIATALALLALVGGGRAVEAGGFCHEEMTDATGTSVNMKNNCMIPTVLRVDPGESVTFSSADLEPHTVTGSGYRDDRGWGSMDELRQGDTVGFTFDESGVFPYFCVVHPGMIGTIVVGDGVPADTSVTSSSRGHASAARESSQLIADEGGVRSDRTTALAVSGAGLLALLAGFGAGVLVWRWRAL